MPFIVRCPQADCQKYMIVEDESRGGSVECLACKRSMRVDAETKPAAPKPAAPSLAAMNPPTARPPVQNTPVQNPPVPNPTQPPSAMTQRVCPNCQTKLQIPATSAGRKIKCPKCSTVF